MTFPVFKSRIVFCSVSTVFSCSTTPKTGFSEKTVLDWTFPSILLIEVTVFSLLIVLGKVQDTKTVTLHKVLTEIYAKELLLMG